MSISKTDIVTDIINTLKEKQEYLNKEELLDILNKIESIKPGSDNASEPKVLLTRLGQFRHAIISDKYSTKIYSEDKEGERHRVFDGDKEIGNVHFMTTKGNCVISFLYSDKIHEVKLFSDNNTGYKRNVEYHIETIKILDSYEYILTSKIHQMMNDIILHIRTNDVSEDTEV